MKSLVVVLLSFLGIGLAQAQTPAIKYPALDTSPMDVVYFPLNVTKAKDIESAKPLIKVVYSRPQRKGREIFGVLEQFDKVWRLGANENTEITFYQNVKIGGQKVKKGTYSLFAVPSSGKWIIIINKQIDRWGAFSYDNTKDIARIEVPTTKLEKPLEVLSMTFTEDPKGAVLYIAWDSTQVSLPIEI